MKWIHSPLPAQGSCRAAALLCALATSVALNGCVVVPGQGTILSRIPPDQGGAASTARPLTDAERQRYDAIDKQVLTEQDQAMAAEAWARYYAPYYYPSPVVYGGYGYYRGWGGGVGYGYGPWW